MGFIGTMRPRPNLQSNTGLPFKATSAYRDTYRNGPGGDLGKGAGSGAPGKNGSGANSKRGGKPGAADALAGKKRAQRSQISIL
jgi:hypothetical protein